MHTHTYIYVYIYIEREREGSQRDDERDAEDRRARPLQEHPRGYQSLEINDSLRKKHSKTLRRASKKLPRASERLRYASKSVQEPPRGLQEPPRGLQKPPRGLPEPSKRRPRDLKEASESLQNASKSAPGRGSETESVLGDLYLGKCWKSIDFFNVFKPRQKSATAVSGETGAPIPNGFPLPGPLPVR